MSEHAGECHHAISDKCCRVGDITSMEVTVCVCLPDSGEFLEENGELLQTWKIQMWVFKEPGGRLEKVLTAAHV